MIDKVLGIIDKTIPNKNLRRITLHFLFWMVWLGRNFYDAYHAFGINSAFIYVAVVFIAQAPMVYFHLYYLVPAFLKSKKYLIYFPVTTLMLVAYSYFNYTLMHATPENWMSKEMLRYIKDLKPTYDVLEGFIVIMLSYALKYTVIAYIQSSELLKLQKEKLQLELNALKAQINPHFFFNTLNNLYSLTLKNSSQSSEVVLKLSDIMRYVLYECNEEKVLLSKELNFISNYLELEKLRYNMKYKIDFNINGNIETQLIAPMLLIEFVENAFKHGLSSSFSSGFLKMMIDVDDQRFKFEIENSKDNVLLNNKSLSGIGLQNVKKRLELLYAEKYDLKIDDNETYKVKLEMDL